MTVPDSRSLKDEHQPMLTRVHGMSEIFLSIDEVRISKLAPMFVGFVIM